MITESERDEPVGGHVTPAVKEALRAEASKTKKSMSQLLHEALVRYLKGKGHDVR